LVTPGLIDLHCHTFPYGSAIGIPADELVAHQATTTFVSAGDAGANNFAAYRRFIVPASLVSQFPSSTTLTMRNQRQLRERLLKMPTWSMASRFG
jgi:hypothetical protein